MHKFVLGLVLLLMVGVFPAMAQEDTIADIVAGDETFSVLLAALEATGLDEVLGGDGTGTSEAFTVFAPTDDAFEALLEDLDITQEDLLAHDDLADILLYHVVATPLEVEDIRQALGFAQQLTVQTVNGVSFAVRVEDDRITVNAAEVLKTDIIAANGVIHVIDDVLLPDEADEFEVEPSNTISGNIMLSVDGDDINITIDRAFVNFAALLRAALNEMDGHDIADIDVSGVVQIDLNDGPTFSVSFGERGISIDLAQIAPGQRGEPFNFDPEAEISLSGVINVEVAGESLVVRIQEASTDLSTLLEQIVPRTERGLNIDAISGELEVDFADGDVFVITLDDGQVSVDIP